MTNSLELQNLPLHLLSAWGSFHKKKLIPQLILDNDLKKEKEKETNLLETSFEIEQGKKLIGAKKSVLSWGANAINSKVNW